MKCAPALKTVRNVLDKKDQEIYELQNRLKKYDSDLRSSEELKRQINFLKKQNEEYRDQLRSTKEELNMLKKNNDKVITNYESLSEEVKPKNELTRDLKSLLVTQDYSDCTINCNGQKYPTHKCILAIRSEPLRQLLKRAIPEPKPKAKGTGAGTAPTTANNSTNNNSNAQIDLNDIDVDVMPFIVNYLYTGDTDNINDKNVQGVMKAADRLDLNGLRGACLVFMENRINKLTCIPILIEAYELNHERLKNKCLKFIQSENIDLVSSPQWTNFKLENPKLALSLYERYVKEQNSSSLNLISNKRDTNFENGQLTSRSNNGHLNQAKNNVNSNSVASWNSNGNFSLNNVRVMNGGNKNIAVDR